MTKTRISFIAITVALALVAALTAFPAWARFKTGAGTRAMGMGNAFVAVADDPTALFWNPAGLDQIGHVKAHFQHDDLSLDRRFNDVGIVFPKVLGGTLGLDFQRFEVNGIKEYTTFAGVDTLVGYFDETETIFRLGYSNQITEWVSLGFNVKYYDQGLKNFTANGFGVDTGMLFTLEEKLSLGIVARDLGGSLHWTGTPTNPIQSIPATFAAGMAYRPRDFITFAMDVEKEPDRAMQTRFGVEFWFKEYVGLRAGTDNGELNLGLSFNLDNWRVDYAYQTTELGDINRVAATVDLESVRDVMRTTFKGARETRVDQRREERGKRRENRELDKLEGKEQTLYRESEALAAAQPPRQIIEYPFTGGAMEDLNGRAETQAEEIVDLTQQAAETYFNKGTAYLADGDYYNATIMFNKAIEINPYYADAYRNLGVIYQRQKMYDEAIRAFEQAAYINPDSEYVYISLGDIYERKGMLDKAVEMYRKVMEIVPGTRTAKIAEKMIDHLRSKN